MGACVVISEGKRRMIIIGDQITLIKNKFLARSRTYGFFLCSNSNIYSRDRLPMYVTTANLFLTGEL